MRVPQLQMEAMRASAQRGRNVAVLRGEEKVADFLQRTLQQPRVFYRREPERTPFVVGGKQGRNVAEWRTGDETSRE